MSAITIILIFYFTLFLIYFIKKIAEAIILQWIARIKDKLKQIFCVPYDSHWVKYNFNKLETRPMIYGKYFVRRKDGKIHWETWNISGWAYNENSITHWMVIVPPKL